MMLSTLLGPSTTRAEKGPTDDFWYRPIGSASASGQNVTSATAIGVAAVYACVRVLSETLASLPLKVYRGRGDEREEAVDHPLTDILARAPNDTQTAFEWREMLMGHLCLRGQAFCEILPGSRGTISQLYPLDPTKMTIERMTDRSLRYTYRGDSISRWIPADQLVHLRYWSDNGVEGISPIQFEADTIGRAIAQNLYLGSYYKNHGEPGGILKTANKLGPDGRERLRTAWENRQSGPGNAGRVAVLEQGLEWQAIGLSADDMRIIEAMKFSKTDICAIYRVPPHMIADLERATFSNIENQDIGFAKHTMLPWCKRWEAVLARSLLSDEPDYYVEFNLDALQRGDIKSRYEAYSIGKQNGWLSTNDIRRKENEPPVEGGDEYLNPLNMRPAGAEQNQDRPQQQPMPDGDMPDEDEEGEDRRRRRRRAATSFAPLWQDAAERIGRAEWREVSKRLPKAEEDLERFAGWLDDFCQRHGAYIEMTLAPIATAWQEFTGQLVDVHRLALAVTAGSRALLLAAPHQNTLDWPEAQIAGLAALFAQEFSNEP
jgi:HK97 family phage portal protein